LRNRAAAADSETVQEADELGRRTVMDLVSDDSAETMDITPGSDIGELASDEKQNRAILLGLAREAECLKGKEDTKLSGAITIIKKMVKDGFRPIVFCRFIPTVHYVAEALRQELPGDV
jgi:hypothetical protein